MTRDLIERMHAIERMLQRKHGLHVHVDRISSDKRNAFCSVSQKAPGLFRSTLPKEELVDKAHSALVPLHSIGLRPLVSVVARSPRKPMLPTDQHDPFGLRVALREAGMEDLLF
jgi:hypothetical protein